ncbi:MAG: rhodanese-like domain-containing protein [Acidimicrobiia bacterium]|nr:rhodanese-like domain-containing protein [Acidimicrobiia bacterium]
MNAQSIPQLSLGEAWDVMSTDPRAVLIDVRTAAEWSFVGVPDLRPLGKELRTVEWTSYPTGAANPEFLAQATDGLERDQNILLLCRSGARSQAAAQMLLVNGFPNVHNIAAGFEGPLDDQGHRRGGWKDELPWVQG